METSVAGGSAPLVLQPTTQLAGDQHSLDETPSARVQVDYQPSPSRMDGASYAPQEDDEDAEARGLEALNQMHEELQEKRRRVKAHQRKARLQVIKQKVDEWMSTWPRSKLTQTTRQE